MARTHFGTDGVRGIVGETLTLDLVEGLGRASTAWAGRGRVFVGRDTRGSGPALEEAVVRGIVSAGGIAVLGGVLPDARRRAAGAGPRDRPLRLAQPARVQRRQVLRRRGPQALGRGRGGDRGVPRRAGGQRRLDRGRRGRRRGLRRAHPRAFRVAARRPPDRRRLRQRRLLGDRAGRLRAPRRRGDDDRRGP